LATHYASADAMLFPSRTETFGNVVTEAMASGLATVSFDYAASRALVEHEVDGFKVAFDAGADAFVDEVLRLEGRGLDTLREVGRRARVTAEGQTWERIVERFEDVLVEVSNEMPAATGGPGEAPTHGSSA
ncbi:MAG: glycosyltransferase, partial [Acidobacteriota bacterium]